MHGRDAPTIGVAPQENGDGFRRDVGERVHRVPDDSLKRLAVHSRNGSIHFVCMDWRHLSEILDAGRAVYSELKNLIVWVKDHGWMGSFYRSRHELVFAFKNGTAAI